MLTEVPVDIAGPRLSGLGGDEAVRLWNQVTEVGAMGRQVLVVGSGPNTEGWKSLGCTTLDIDGQCGADVVADANDLVAAVGPNGVGRYDVVIVECLPVNLDGANGRVRLKNLLNGVFQCLTDNGRCLLVSANFTMEGEFEGQEYTERTGFSLETLRSAALACGFREVSAYLGDLSGTETNPRTIGDKVVIDGLFFEAFMLAMIEK